MGKIIHPLQGAFIPDRIIQDNIILANEVFQSFKNKCGKEGGWIAIKLDMEKAYDRLERNYIFVTLDKLGFHPKWVSWIKICISSVSFTVLVNEVPGNKFSPSRGIRQGDPLSLYLFILCGEPLAKQLHQHSFSEDKNLGFKVGRSGIKIPFLTFVDDTMIFAKANEESCFTIKHVLSKYYEISDNWLISINLLLNARKMFTLVCVLDLVKFFKWRMLSL